jgi:hypothetical protein
MTATYQIWNDPVSGQRAGVKRLSDGAFIPLDPDNRDYAEYLAWVDAGNTPDPPASTAKRKGLFR